MRYIWQHIFAIIGSYDGAVPLAHFLKGYFKQHPILGSRDRKVLSTMAYSWYRAARALNQHGVATAPNEAGIRQCLALTNNMLPQLKADADETPIPFVISHLFPFDIALSVGIEKEQWLGSMLVQPDLFIRIRKEKQLIIHLLTTQGIPFTYITDHCLTLPNGAKIDSLLPEDCYVVQDASSQQTGNYFAPKKKEQWYDCCSGAGGKSLLLKDMEPGVRLTVSDARESIIHNLSQRFRLYKHILPVANVVDVTNKEALHKTLGAKLFDHIICDAPCSGSGTWSRTPEQFYFFDPKKLDRYTTLQRTIAANVAEYLKPGGSLFYITCSVFEVENEQAVDAIVRNTGLHVAHTQLINGIGIKADSMYLAVLKKV